jgi:hypothetical protein
VIICDEVDLLTMFVVLFVFSLKDPHSDGYWEPYHYLFLIGTIGISVAAATSAPNTDPHQFTRQEAQERLKRRENGEEVVYGVNYAAIKFMKENKAISMSDAEKLERGEILQKE